MYRSQKIKVHVNNWLMNGRERDISYEIWLGFKVLSTYNRNFSMRSWRVLHIVGLIRK